MVLLVLLLLLLLPPSTLMAHPISHSRPISIERQNNAIILVMPFVESLVFSLSFSMFLLFFVLCALARPISFLFFWCCVCSTVLNETYRKVFCHSLAHFHSVATSF